MRAPNEQDKLWLKANPEGVEAIYRVGMEKGAEMRWPEMLFWICLVMFLFNLAVGGV